MPAINGNLGLVDRLEIALNQFIMGVEERVILSMFPRPEKVDHSQLKECYSKIYDVLSCYEQLLPTHISLSSGIKSLDDIGSIIRDAEGEGVPDAQRVINDCKRKYSTMFAKFKDNMDYFARLTRDIFAIIELFTGYTVLSEFMTGDKLKQLKNEEILNSFPAMLDEHKQKFMSFYNLRINTINKMKKLGLYPSP